VHDHVPLALTRTVYVSPLLPVTSQERP
jgi:hypothetical protein